MKPAQPVLVQHEWRVPRNCLESGFVSGWPKLRRFFDWEIGLIVPGPFALGLIPPDQLLPIAPRLAGRAGARSIIYNTAVARPGEAPTMPEEAFRITRKRLVDFVRAEDARINPTAAGGRPVSL